MSKLPRVCPECGGDRWRAREYERMQRDVDQATRDARNLAARNGILAYEAQLTKIEEAERQSVLQRKIIRQARVIKRLEARLREAKIRPYEGAKLGETSTGAEFDAAE